MRMDSTAIMKRFKVLLSPERKRIKSLGFKKTHEKDKSKKKNHTHWKQSRYSQTTCTHQYKPHFQSANNLFALGFTLAWRFWTYPAIHPCSECIYLFYVSCLRKNSDTNMLWAVVRRRWLARVFMQDQPWRRIWRTMRKKVSKRRTLHLQFRRKKKRIF